MTGRTATIAASMAAAVALAAPAAAQSVRRPEPGPLAAEIAAPTLRAPRRPAFRPGPVPVRSWPEAAAPLPAPPAVPLQIPPDRWFASDKLKHFFLSFGVTGFAYAGARLAGAGDAAVWLAPATAAVAGLGKEISDCRRAWGFSVKDLVWDAAGIVGAMLVVRDAS